MMVGSEAPEWARNLLYKWVEYDDPFFKEKVTCFIFNTDYFDSGPSEFKVRIFFESEDNVRLTLKRGSREPGIAASYICQDKYKVIDVPFGLEDWTNKEIENFQKENNE